MSQSKLRFWGLFLGVAVLAGCPDKDKAATKATDEPAAGQAAGGTAPEVGGEDIKEVVLGMPAVFSGPSAGLGVEMWRGASAAFTDYNKHPKFGRTIKLIVEDDGYEADRAAKAVERLAEKDVFAFFGGVGTPTITKALPTVKEYFDSKDMFYFSNFTGAQIQRTSPYDKAVFNVRASYEQETERLVKAYLDAGKRRIGMFIQDDAYGQSGREGVIKALAKNDLFLIEVATYPRGQAYAESNKKQVAQLKKSNVDAIIAVGAYAACGGFIRDARRDGYNVPIANLSFVGSDQLHEMLMKEQEEGGLDLLTNLINSQVVPSYNDMSAPAVRRYRNSIDKNNPTAPQGLTDLKYYPTQKYSFGSLEGYISAQAFLAIMDKVGSKPFNRKSFYVTAENFGPMDLGVNELGTLTPEDHQILDMVWLTYATKEGWMPVDARKKVIF